MPAPLSDPEPEIYPKIHKQEHSTSKALGVSSSTTGTLYNSQTSTTTQATISTSTTSTTSHSTLETTTPTTSTPSATIGVTKQAASTPPAEAEEWKVIGMVTLGIAFVGIVMFAITFFDSWWGFLLAVVGKKKEVGMEDFDWMPRDGELKIAREEGHRYPSLDSLTKATPTSSAPMPISPDPHQCLVPSLPPAVAYSPMLDPRPFEPLFRRASDKTT
ncbi:hypothetical protein FB45DRAFT_560269 [Roridomyces roridus]|uniref:Transmembrane protein n=1 Tax=Roridomyces roridus TaxID=1738132 RepID=A0AAD7BVD0_9AGAR|nr:hypothetical protein FB45DRAFT_560269 [Roridomyces roridus]